MSAPRRTTRFAPNVPAARRADARDANIAAAAADAPPEVRPVSPPPPAAAAPAAPVARKPLRPLGNSGPSSARRGYRDAGGIAAGHTASAEIDGAAPLEDVFAGRPEGDPQPVALGRAPQATRLADPLACGELFVAQVPRCAAGLARGVLRRHASGRTVLVLGGVAMDGARSVGEELAGAGALGTRQVLAVAPGRGAAYVLGAPCTHLVFSPSDDADLLRLLSP